MESRLHKAFNERIRLVAHIVMSHVRQSSANIDWHKEMVLEVKPIRLTN